MERERWVKFVKENDEDNEMMTENKRVSEKEKRRKRERERERERERSVERKGKR